MLVYSRNRKSLRLNQRGEKVDFWKFDVLIMVLLLLSRKISGVENQCALYCTEKYLKMNQRISTRFQEFQMMSNENAMAVIKKSGQL